MAARGRSSGGPTDSSAPAVPIEEMAPGRVAILTATIAALDEQGEAGVRVVDIAERAGVAIGLISRHFGGRDGLIAEAQLVRFRTSLTSELALVRAALSNDASDVEAAGVAGRALTSILDEQRQRLRLQRMAMIGAAHGRPQLLEQLRDAQAAVLDAWEEVFAAGQRAGRVTTSMSARTAATLMLGSAFGLSMWDLDGRAVAASELARGMTELLGVLLQPSAARSEGVAGE